jgi:hypothetical protein
MAINDMDQYSRADAITKSWGGPPCKIWCAPAILKARSSPTAAQPLAPCGKPMACGECVG